MTLRVATGATVRSRGHTAQIRVTPGVERDAQRPACAANVADGCEPAEIEFFGEHGEVAELNTGHRGEELLQPRRIGVERRECVAPAVRLGLILRQPCLQRLVSPAQFRYKRRAAITKNPPI